MTEDVILYRSWVFGDGQSEIKPGGNAQVNMQAQHAYLSSGFFEVGLTVQNGAGCVSTDWVEVEVIDDMLIFVPSAFSPNNDGNNDGFGPVMTGVESFNMVIYDRWGRPVFETDDEDWWWRKSKQ